MCFLGGEKAKNEGLTSFEVGPCLFFVIGEFQRLIFDDFAFVVNDAPYIYYVGVTYFL